MRAAISLDETAMFNAVLSDHGFQKWILDLNRSQLFSGEDSEGKELGDIGGGYSPTTEFLNEGIRFSFNPKDSGIHSNRDLPSIPAQFRHKLSLLIQYQAYHENSSFMDVYMRCLRIGGSGCRLRGCPVVRIIAVIG